jgi:tetratricopeptide (TPR) repeat protein
MNPTPHPSPSRPSIPEPRRPPAHFFGRDEYVAEMVRIVNGCIKAGRGARLVVRGYGGIGKTSVALAVCHHPEIRDLFGEFRFFIECEAAETPALLLQEVADSLGINLSNGDAQSVVAEQLKVISNNQSLLLILDNAETFLHYSDFSKTKEINDILSYIAAIPSITLILTKRGPEQPIAVKWDVLEELDVLSLAAAREIFFSITNPNFVSSERTGVDSLLAAVDCVPLAVELLAQVAQSGNESLEKLHNRWTKRRTDLLKLPGHDHRETSVSASIEVSLRSQLMEESSHAKRLLSMISYLPEGVLFSHVERLSADWQIDVDDAAHVLKRLSLAHEASNRFFLTTLSPIREHIRRNYTIQDTDLQMLRQWHLELANKADRTPSDPTTQADLALNHINISHVLQRYIESDRLGPDVVVAALNFSSFLYWWCPSTDLLLNLLASKHAGGMTDDTLGAVYLKLGQMFHARGDYVNAKVEFKRARFKFEALGCRLEAAKCTRNLGETFGMLSDNDTARTELEKARSESEELGDLLGAAQCIRSLGSILYTQKEYDGSRLEFERARSKFEALGYRLGVAQCIQCLGHILSAQYDHIGAKVAFEEARSEFEVLGDRLEAAQCMECLGYIHLLHRDDVTAKVELEKARLVCGEFGDRLGVARCSKSLDIIHRSPRTEFDHRSREESRRRYICL